MSWSRELISRSVGVGAGVNTLLYLEWAREAGLQPNQDLYIENLIIALVSGAISLRYLSPPVLTYLVASVRNRPARIRANTSEGPLPSIEEAPRAQPISEQEKNDESLARLSLATDLALGITPD